jgi:hypothetical protein
MLQKIYRSKRDGTVPSVYAQRIAAKVFTAMLANALKANDYVTAEHVVYIFGASE